LRKLSRRPSRTKGSVIPGASFESPAVLRRNLSFKLCRQLNDLFGDSGHVHLIGLGSPSAPSMWRPAFRPANCPSSK
jgi:hypothetical protein